MIKVINNAMEDEEVFDAVCQHCGSELEYTLSDTILEDDTDNLGFNCPVCGKFHVVEYAKPFQFPEAFYHVSSDHGAVEVNKKDAQKMVDDCVNRLLKSSEDFDFIIFSFGNTLVIAIKADNEITVIVTKDYYKTETCLN